MTSMNNSIDKISLVDQRRDTPFMMFGMAIRCLAHNTSFNYYYCFGNNLGELSARTINDKYI